MAGLDELVTLDRIRYHSLSEATRRFPSFRNGAPVHVSTLTRWILAGVKGRDGRHIKLQAKRLPGRWVVSDDAVTEFIEALTADKVGSTAADAPVCTANQRSRAAERASRELDRIGI